MIPHITRIAPSPTGMFHLGTLRTAYMNYLAARASGGRFILRIDDTDIERNLEEYVKVILDTLHWLDLEWDEIHFQSERIKIYTETAQWLVEREKAYVAGNGAILLKGFVRAPNSFKDEISGDIPITRTNIDQINDKVVLLRGGEKKGQATYQFSSVCDDYNLGVTNIIRGVDHITNTPKQIAIWQNLVWQSLEWDSMNGVIEEDESLPLFTHLGLIFKDGKKLSKRDGAASVLWYRDNGYTPEAVLSWVLRMGWSLKIPRDKPEAERKRLQELANGYISKDEAIELFYQGALKNSPCNYSIDKLNAIQKGLK